MRAECPFLGPLSRQDEPLHILVSLSLYIDTRLAPWQP
ncbi:hypothetical protein NT01EI_2411 [Edwardsiella ictaluri 93-146]|uniref:Uncharacterized protein n=1 Tax=Edwardsiella ictaluri (strain 93-146) TaxID=634503 RepID=C5BAA1_EDWI9|nr:hypothetical protein NT01EI_2411 [Edwardsiella ictaluri 93-146]